MKNQKSKKLKQPTEKIYNLKDFVVYPKTAWAK